MAFSEVLSEEFSVIQIKSSGQLKEKIHATQMVMSFSLK